MFGVSKEQLERYRQDKTSVVDKRKILRSTIKESEDEKIREVEIEVIKEVEVPICTKLGECDVCCEENKHPYAAIPCGHSRVCGDCLSKVRKCPACRKEITDFLKLYI